MVIGKRDVEFPVGAPLGVDDEAEEGFIEGEDRSVDVLLGCKE